MNVKWMPRALLSLDKISLYLIEKDAPNAAKKITVKLWRTANVLGDFPFLGKIELVFNEGIIVRSLVSGKNFKIIYYYDANIVYIIDIWDVRQDPTKLKILL